MTMLSLVAPNVEHVFLPTVVQVAPNVVKQ